MAIDFTTLCDGMRFVFANPVTVTLTRPKTPWAAAASVTVNQVQMQSARQGVADDPMGGDLDGDRRTFRLWLVECQGLPPSSDYEITAPDGSVWTVKQMDTLCKGREFRCHCMARVGTLP